MIISNMNFTNISNSASTSHIPKIQANSEQRIDQKKENMVTITNYKNDFPACYELRERESLFGRSMK